MLLGSTGTKAARRTLMKLTPWVDFTNVLQAALVQADPKRVKNTNDVTVFFCAFGI
jgi:hypothetical protein